MGAAQSKSKDAEKEKRHVTCQNDKEDSDDIGIRRRPLHDTETESVGFVSGMIARWKSQQQPPPRNGNTDNTDNNKQASLKWIRMDVSEVKSANAQNRHGDNEEKAKGQCGTPTTTTTRLGESFKHTEDAATASDATTASDEQALQSDRTRGQPPSDTSGLRSLSGSEGGAVRMLFEKTHLPLQPCLRLDDIVVETRDYKAMHKPTHRVRLLVGSNLSYNSSLIADLVQHAMADNAHVRILQIVCHVHDPIEFSLTGIDSVKVLVLDGYDPSKQEWQFAGMPKTDRAWHMSNEDAAGACSRTQASPSLPHVQRFASADRSVSATSTNAFVIMTVDVLIAIYKERRLRPLRDALYRACRSMSIDLLVLSKHLDLVPAILCKRFHCLYLVTPPAKDATFMSIVRLFCSNIAYHVGTTDWEQIKSFMIANPFHALVFDFAVSWFRARHHLCFYRHGAKIM